jgi:hypothetical protein
MARERTQPGYFPEMPESPRPYTRMRIRIEDSDGNTVSSSSDSCSDDGQGADADDVDNGDVVTPSDASDGSRASDAVVSSDEDAHVSFDLQTQDETSLQSALPESGASLQQPARVAVVNVKSWQGMLNEAKASSGGFSFSFLSPAESAPTAPLNAANAAVVSKLTGKQQPAVRPAFLTAVRVEPLQELLPEPKKSRDTISYSALRADSVAPLVHPLGSAAQRMLASVKRAASAPADKQRRLRIDFKRKAKEALKLSFRKRSK